VDLNEGRTHPLSGCLALVCHPGTALTSAQFQLLVGVPLEIEGFANVDNPQQHYATGHSTSHLHEPV